MSLQTKSACLFCLIEQDKQPAQVIYADQHCVAILDAFPLKPAHVLILSRIHVERFEQLPVEIAQHLTRITQNIAVVLTETGFAAQGYNLVVNNGKVANQHIAHVHLHLIPRQQGDRLTMAWRYLTRFVVDRLFWSKRQQQLAKIAESLRQAIKSSVQQ